MSETRMFPDGVALCPAVGPALGLALGLSLSLCSVSPRGLCFSGKSGLLSDVLQYCI